MGAGCNKGIVIERGATVNNYGNQQVNATATCNQEDRTTGTEYYKFQRASTDTDKEDLAPVKNQLIENEQEEKLMTAVIVKINNVIYIKKIPDEIEEKNKPSTSVRIESEITT
uniref:Uncharacterized LOC100185522 n=1 Tax=Ciona intestinalis TaxID=7719 RepID=F6XZN3_CIOIN|nr:uncharacterized protein LOC100185522 [Ciona intestinalis]|eukprot:XP_002129494.1 uncharacterized protein LOC100185522 [Ciona intestinalis]